MEAHTVSILLLGDEKCGKSTFLSYVSYPSKKPSCLVEYQPLTPDRRISKGAQSLVGEIPITLLRDIDQPFVFEIRTRKAEYRFQFYDTSSPESWRLLKPDLIVFCYDISQRLSLINLQRVVCTADVSATHLQVGSLTCI